MKYSCGLMVAICALMTSPATSAQNGDAAMREAIDAVVAEVKPALVRIHVVSTYYSGGRENKYQSSGSGAIISPDGYVITNHHVAGNATRLLCTLSNREEVDATLIGTDPLTDIAVIKLDQPDGRTYPVARFGDSDAVVVGDHVLAMGSPLSISQSVTLGIVSNTAMVMPRRMGFGNFQLDGEDVGALVRWIAHDAAIFPGNSGGPLVSINGEIIGINEISFGLGGAIPGNLAKSVAHDLIQNGAVERAWLGLNVQPLLKHGDASEGVLVTGVIDGSPADSAGIESGDLLLELAGTPVTVRFDEQIPEFNNIEAQLPVGQDIEAIVMRDGERKSVAIKSAARERVLPQERELRNWGITARDLSLLLAKEFKRDTTDGVHVTTVRPGGPAGDAKPAIQESDIITAVDGKAVTDLESLVAITRDIVKDSEEPVPVLTTFERKASSYVTVVELGITELMDPGLEVRKAWLPVATQVITRDVAKLLGDEDLTGFRVTQTYDVDGEASGLEIGDLILAVDGERLRASATEHYEELRTLIRNYKIGTEVQLRIRRDGEVQTVTTILRQSPKLSREMRKYRDDNFEYTVRDVTFFDKADEQIEDNVKGVLVEEVTSGGWAALGQLQNGDVILRVDAKEIGSVGDIRDVMAGIESEQPKSVTMTVLRGIYTVFVELEPKWENGA